MSILRMNLEPGAPTNFSGEFEPVRADSVVAAPTPRLSSSATRHRRPAKTQTLLTNKSLSAAPPALRPDAGRVEGRRGAP